MNNKKFTSILVLGLCVLIPVQVHATSSSVIDPYEKIPYVDNETSLGVQVVDYIPDEVLAFEVPLYVTCAVVDLESSVITPTEYGITNLTQIGDDGVDIAVTQVEATLRETNGYWEFVDTLSEEDDIDNEMQLDIGGIPLVINGEESILLDLHHSVFYDSETEKFVPITFGERAVADIVGKVKPSLRTADETKTAVAQFSIKYTVSLLDESGDPVGIYYEGPMID